MPGSSELGRAAAELGESTHVVCSGTGPQARRRENQGPTGRLESHDRLSPDGNTALPEGLLFPRTGSGVVSDQTDGTTMQKTSGLLGLAVAYMVPLIVLS